VNSSKDVFIKADHISFIMLWHFFLLLNTRIYNLFVAM